jgi:transposase
MAKSIRIKESAKQVDRTRVAAIGLDLGDRTGTFWTIDHEGNMIERGSVGMRKAVVEQWASLYPPTVIAIEAGGHSPWISRVLRAAGHEVAVANPAKIPLISKNKRKHDRVDPELLARLVRFERKLLFEIQHRGEEAQQDLQIIRTREITIQARTKLIGHVRGTVKSYGLRVAQCSAECFVRTASEAISGTLLEIVKPILETIDQLTRLIRDYDRKVEQLVETKYPEAKLLTQIKGVGSLTALAYVLVIEDVNRFSSSRSVGAYVGMVPATDQSGDSDPQLGITKAGDRLLRRLLIQSAHYILGPFGVDSDLRRHGQAIASRGGKKAKRRAAVAVARKLAVLLHRLWKSGDAYDPLFNAKTHAEALAGTTMIQGTASAMSSMGLSL